MGKNSVLIISFLIVLSGFTKQTFSQVLFTIDSSEVQTDKITKRTYGIDAIGKDKDYFYYLYLPYRAAYNEISHGSTESYFLAKYDHKLNLINKAEINLTEGKKEKQFQGIFHLNDKLYLFSSFQNEKEKKHYLFVQSINKETLAPNEDIKLIGEIDYSGLNKYNTTYFNYEFSGDSSKVLVYFNMVNKSDENLKYGMYVYDNLMNLLWKNENIVPQFGEGVFSYKEFKIDNDANVYLLGKIYKDLKNYNASAMFRKIGFFSSDKYFPDLPNYTYQLYKFSNNGTTEKNIFIRLNGKFIRSLAFLPVNESNIQCAGVYSSEETISAKGSFTFKIDMVSGKTENIDTKEFSSDLIEAGLDEKELENVRESIKDNEEWDPYNYLLSDVITRENGEKYIIAEQYLVGEKKESNGKYVYYKPIYIRNDIFIINISAENKIDRIDKVTKRQYSVSTEQYSSYGVNENNGSFYFVFMDILRKNTMLKNAETGNTYLVAIDSKGEQKRSIIYDAEEKQKIFFLPETFIPLNPTQSVYSLASMMFKDYFVEKITINK